MAALRGRWLQADASRGRGQDFYSGERRGPPDGEGDLEDSASDPRDALWQSALLGTIEGEIIPRLLLAHAGGAAGLVDDLDPDGPVVVSEREVLEFARILIEQDIELAAHYVQAVRLRGVATEPLLLDLFAPAARELGDMWLRDDCSFADVTVGLCSLERLLMRETSSDETDPLDADAAKVAFLAPMPGEQHVFGLLIVKQLFRRAGWTVRGDSTATAAEQLAVLKRKWFTIAGLSVSCEEALPDCAAQIRAMRAASCNPDLFIIVGGKAFQKGSGQMRFIGADAVAADGCDAVEKAENRVAELNGDSLRG